MINLQQNDNYGLAHPVHRQGLHQLFVVFFCLLLVKAVPFVHQQHRPNMAYLGKQNLQPLYMVTISPASSRCGCL